MAWTLSFNNIFLVRPYAKLTRVPRQGYCEWEKQEVAWRSFLHVGSPTYLLQADRSTASL